MSPAVDPQISLFTSLIVMNGQFSGIFDVSNGLFFFSSFKDFVQKILLALAIDEDISGPKPRFSSYSVTWPSQYDCSASWAGGWDATDVCLVALLVPWTTVLTVDGAPWSEESDLYLFLLDLTLPVAVEIDVAPKLILPSSEGGGGGKGEQQRKNKTERQLSLSKKSGAGGAGATIRSFLTQTKYTEESYPKMVHFLKYMN